MEPIRARRAQQSIDVGTSGATEEPDSTQKFALIEKEEYFARWHHYEELAKVKVAGELEKDANMHTPRYLLMSPTKEQGRSSKGQLPH